MVVAWGGGAVLPWFLCSTRSGHAGGALVWIGADGIGQERGGVFACSEFCFILYVLLLPIILGFFVFLVLFYF